MYMNVCMYVCVCMLFCASLFVFIVVVVVVVADNVLCSIRRYRSTHCSMLVGKQMSDAFLHLAHRQGTNGVFNLLVTSHDGL